MTNGTLILWFTDKGATSTKCTLEEALRIQNLPVEGITKFEWIADEDD